MTYCDALHVSATQRAKLYGFPKPNIEVCLVGQSVEASLSPVLKKQLLVQRLILHNQLPYSL